MCVSDWKFCATGRLFLAEANSYMCQDRWTENASFWTVSARQIDFITYNSITSKQNILNIFLLIFLLLKFLHLPITSYKNELWDL